MRDDMVSGAVFPDDELTDHLPRLDFGRALCGDLVAARRREWLVTNGIGGYAAGTVAGVLTRRYHGLLLAALRPPLARTLLLAKLDETATYRARDYPLHTNHWGSGAVTPAGYLCLERFHLEGTTPVWTYACADALLEKRIWMEHGANTTYIHYTLRRGTAPLALELKALVDYRDHHGDTHAGAWTMGVAAVDHGLRVDAFDSATPFYLLSAGAEAAPQHDWYRDFFLSVESERGLAAHEDHLCAGIFQAILRPGQSLTVVASTDPRPTLDGASAYAVRQGHEQRLVALSGLDDAPGEVRHLVEAADAFLVRRPVSGPNGHTVMAGYPWFEDWGRDTMISLPGLTLATKRPHIARRILHTFAGFVDGGMLPNRFPDAGGAPEYNTVDAALWYVEAVRAYHAATDDDDLPRELFPVLRDIVDCYHRGTRYNIHVDPDDGLLYSGEDGVQLTWMDAKVGTWVVTPRTGKAVEVNALWYNALRALIDVARRLGEPVETYDRWADETQAGFGRFWNEARGYCYDVVDTPTGNDPALRPNQILAVALASSPLDSSRQQAVVDACAQHLLTSHGLRSLAPADPAYVGHYGGDQRARDGAYHQGTVWAWLIGPFVAAHLRVYRDPALARSFLPPLLRQLADYGVGSVGEIFDGDAPFGANGCIAQAWSVAEVLRAWLLTEDTALRQGVGDAPTA